MIGAATTGVPVAWLVARAAGLVAFGLLTLSVWLGLSISTRLLAPRNIKSLVAWHQTLVWTAVGMFGLHGLALLLDPTLHFGFMAVLVPGTAPWRPLAVSAGVVAAWLMLLLALSFRYRRRIGQKNWRRFHYAAFAAFFVGLGHGLTVGSDLRGGIGLVAAALALGPVLWLTFFRVLSPQTLARPARTAATPAPVPPPATRDPDPNGAGVIGDRLLEEPFAAMGTVGVVAVTTGRLDEKHARRALTAGRAEIDACERVLSRFDPESDLSALNRAEGERIDADERLIDALRLAVRARSDTGGRFDPTILPALVAAGYDRGFDELELDRPPTPIRGLPARAEISVDTAAGRARLEAGAGVDLGGIGKGFAADRALAAMLAAWPEMHGGLVDLGGDVAVRGIPPDGGPWLIAIEDPRQEARLLGTLELRRGAVATSGRDRRRFGPGGSLHHLIDPETGAPAKAGPLAVTVVAVDGAEAEAHATALALVDVADAISYVAGRPLLSALLVPDDGEPIVLGDLPLVEAPA